MKSIMGSKLQMTQMFTETGERIPLTAIKVGPCPIVQVKSEETRDGYNAIQIAYMPTKEKLTTKPMMGHYTKSGIAPHKFLREIRLPEKPEYSVGDHLDASGFEIGDRVDVTGVSKGRGFQGGVKRHNWGGGRKTHGSMFHRAIGAIAAGTGQARIFKGKTLPGHMGVDNVTIQNLEVMKVDSENGILYVKGGIPGPNGGVVFVKQTTKFKKN